jgi:hypothetical protein
MGKLSDAFHGVDRFLVAVAGIEVSEDLPDGMCPGVDMPVVLGKCQKPGPHGPHRGDEPPVYDN